MRAKCAQPRQIRNSGVPTAVGVISAPSPTPFKGPCPLLMSVGRSQRCIAGSLFIPRKESDHVHSIVLRSDAIARHLSAPLVYERSQYLNHCVAQGFSRNNLRRKACMLLSTVEYLRLAKRPNDTINHSHRLVIHTSYPRAETSIPNAFATPSP